MRKITINAVAAFHAGRSFKSGNTAVTVDADSGAVAMALHGNKIAERDAQGDLAVTHAGWPTLTTKERLNGIEGVDIFQKKGVWYLNGEAWGGEWKKV